MIYDLSKWDRSIQIGDYVFNGHRHDNFIYKVINIEPRFYTADDLRYSVHAGHFIGEEYSPKVIIQRAIDLSIDYKVSKKFLMKKIISCNMLVKYDEKILINHVKRLSELIDKINMDKP
jgi:hypothetical protein